MAKSKLKGEDISAHFFMSIRNTQIELIYHDEAKDYTGLGAALASIMQEDEELLKIFSAALITVLESKEKFISKKSNIVHKKPAKSQKEK